MIAHIYPRDLLRPVRSSTLPRRTRSIHPRRLITRTKKIKKEFSPFPEERLLSDGSQQTSLCCSASRERVPCRNFLGTLSSYRSRSPILAELEHRLTSRFLGHLSTNPLRTKAITSGALSALQEFLASYIAGEKSPDGTYFTSRVPKMAFYGV